MDDRKKWLYLVAGLALGAAGTFLALRFPGGGGGEPRLELSYRQGIDYQVRRVIDGDTLVLEPGLRLRYAGVDCPETAHFDYSRPQELSREATEANRRLVEGRRVRLRFGPRKLDKYGRLLACVQVRDPETGRWQDVGEELMRLGLAKRVYKAGRPPNEAALIRAEEEAKGARRGLWARERGSGP